MYCIMLKINKYIEEKKLMHSSKSCHKLAKVGPHQSWWNIPYVAYSKYTLTDLFISYILKPVLLDEKHTTQSHYYRKAFDVAINVLREGGGQFA
jgi:hypothetical protein